MPHGVLTLGQLAERLTHLEVRCSRCERRRGRLARLIAPHGADFPAPELRHLLAGDCPNRNASLYERCDVYFPNVVDAFYGGGGEGCAGAWFKPPPPRRGP